MRGGHDSPVEGDIIFWGEWEPPSRMRAIDTPQASGPRYIAQPYLCVPSSYDSLQNTDPFVFGETFLYTGCQQWTKKGPTQLRYLKPGSVILFGSNSSGRFYLDTVFVVQDSVDHCHSNRRERLAGLPNEYRIATLEPWYDAPGALVKSCVNSASSDLSSGCAPGQSEQTFRLYFGATPEQPTNGMFSFFPCQPERGSDKGFVRPEVCLPGIVTPTLRQGKRLNRHINPGPARECWEEVVRQVTAGGCYLGISAAMPPLSPQAAPNI